MAIEKNGLAEAESVLSINLNDAAGRTAYLAGFYAAQAFICERTGKSVKTHKGVHGRRRRAALTHPALARLFLEQVPTGRVVAVRGRVRRQIGYDGVYLKFERAEPPPR